ncbi:MAG: OmpA family protein, partial [bacterium]|nr:OmpA family protein [Candidatus Kapabacteria bacterium]
MAIAVLSQGDSVPAATRWLSVGAAISGGPSFEYGNVVVPLCDPVTSGTALSWNASAFVERPLSQSLAMQLRVGAYIERGELRHRGLIAPTRGEDGTVFTGVYDEVLRFNRTMIATGMLARYQLSNRLELGIGIEATREISTDQQFQLEAIAPAELLFRGKRIDERASGVIVQPASIALGAFASVGYRLPISRSSWLVPELSFSFPATSMAADDAWRRIRIGVGAALQFDLLDEVEAPPIDTPVVVHVPVLRPIITTSPAIVEVRVDEYDSLEALPLLNQVFFAEGSDAIPTRYNQLGVDATRSFTLSQLDGSALDVYYDLLNIIGLRMKQTPSATLAITGHRNGRESDNRLSRRRADEIRRYLVESWGIAARRFRVSGAGLPSSPARETAVEGFEENARAHIVPSDPNITAPVIRRHVQRVATPPSLIFYPRADAEAGLAKWRLEVLE